MSNRNSQGRGRREYGSGRRNADSREKEKETDDSAASADVDETRAGVLSTFKDFQIELDRRYDLTERLVKKSRDVTIESKRIIFLLHRMTSGDGESVLAEANRRLTELREKNLKAIAEELQGQDRYAFLNSYSPGLEEFIEALSYYNYLKNGALISWKSVQEQLIFNKTQDGSGDALESLSLYLPPTTYVLGIADLSGELMRKCINDVGAGDVQSPFQLRPLMRDILDGFVRIGNGPRELNNKLRVMYQNVAKVDNACYAIHVRRTEIPDYKLTDMTLVVSNSLERGGQEQDETFAENI